MRDGVRFFLAIEAIGLAATPIAACLFARLPGRGLGLGKPLGLLICAWLVWLGATSGAVAYGNAATVGAIAAIGVTGVVLWRRGRRTRPIVAGLDRRLFIAAELVFAVSFAAAVLLASFSPDVWNTEKPMDMGIVNAINVSDRLPPHDMWLAGSDLNYYYVGHLMAAMLVRLTGVEPTVGYNLAVALFFALAATAVFTLTASLWAALRASRETAREQFRASPVTVGLAALVLALVLGNLYGADALFDGKPLADYDWFGASRVTPDTINEFPYFSFLLGDLHAHLLAIPCLLVALCFALQIALAGPRLGLSLRALAELLATALVIGVLYPINSWSYPVAAGLVALALGVWLSSPESRGRRRAALAWGAALLLASVLAVLPFHLTYDPASAGFGAVRVHRGFTHFVRDQVLVYGLFWWLLAAPLAGRLLATAKPLRNAVWGFVAAIVIGSALAERDVAGLALIVAALAAFLRAMLSPRLAAAEQFVWLLVCGGLLCIAIPEAVYVRDAFDHSALYRMNTVFKLGHQAWLLLAVAGAVLAFGSRAWLARWPRRAWLAGLVPLALLAAVYPLAGTYARTARFSGKPHLDGLRWLERRAPGDIAAIRWLRRNAAPDAVILEAAGNDYSPQGHGRISTFTGRPAVIGWEGHEDQWGHDPRGRRRDVRRLYRARHAAVAAPLLRRYGVRYVVVGPLERTDYGSAGIAKWDRLGVRVMVRGATAIWDLRR